MRSIGLFCIWLVITASTVKAQEDHSYKTEPALAGAIYSSLVTSAFVDFDSTRKALRVPGSREAGLIFAPCNNSTTCIGVTKFAATTAIGLAIDQGLGRTKMKPWLRRTLQVGLTAAASGFWFRAAVHNYSLTGRYQK